MTDRYPANCLSIDRHDDTYKEKTKIAEVATATLCRLNGIMKQMKDWREDRVKLRSNIWRLKLALRVAGKETNDILHVDPLIEHQREEIKHLKADNQSLRMEIADIKAVIVDENCNTNETTYGTNEKLGKVNQEYLVEREYLNNEILYLKSRLKEVEEGHEHNSEVEHLKCKLKHFMMVDHTMEIIFTDIVNKVAETIAHLCEELVKVNEHLYKSKQNNDHLCIKIDKLQAILRSRSGNILDYKKRIVELDNLMKHLKKEVGQFKVNLEDKPNQSTLKNVELLTIDLKNRLKNDYEALLSAGDPHCLKYIQKIVELRIHLKQLHIQLPKPNVDLCPAHKLIECTEYLEQLSSIRSHLKDINIEIDQLKDEHVKRNLRIGDSESLQYLKKVEDLKEIIEQMRLTIDELNCHSEKDLGKGIAKLDDFVARVCYEIKQLEMIITFNDRSTFFKRIEHLKKSIVGLKVESNEKEQRVNILNKELFNMKMLLEQRTKEVKTAENKVDALTKENDALKVKTKELEERTSELQHENEASKKELGQLQQMRRDISMTKKRLQNLQAENEKLLTEKEGLHDILKKSDQEINAITVEKHSVEKTLNAKILDLKKNLQVVTKENGELLNKVNEFEEFKCKIQKAANVKKEHDNKGHLRIRKEYVDAELEQVISNLQMSKEALDIAHRDIVDLKTKLEHLSKDKAKLEAYLSDLESRKELIVNELAAERTIADERFEELKKLRTKYNQSDIERISLRNESEQLKMELANLMTEKQQLKAFSKTVNTKCSNLEGEVNKYRFECGVLEEEVKNFKIEKENLVTELEQTRTELKGTEDKIRQLEFEILKLRDNLNDLTLKNTSLESRVQVLLTEKNDLVTRINELDGENVALKDQLNKVKTENEYSFVELNKLRMERDKVKSENASLQNMLDKTYRSNEALKKMTEELKIKLNEMGSECRILENQLKILQIGIAALKKEKEKLQHEYASNECNQLTVERLIKKVDNETKRKIVKSNKKGNDKTKSNEKLKELLAENEALKFEVLNLKNKNFEVKMQLTRMKEELQKQETELARSKADENDRSNKLEIVNLYYKEINSYSSHHFNISALARVDQSSICPVVESMIELQSGIEIEKLIEVLNKLKIENVALKMEVNTLRCNFVVNAMEDERKRSEVRDVQEEMRALKIELTKLREEKESLQARLETTRTKLDEEKSEKDALKNELYALRKTNSELQRRVNELQYDYHKLKETSKEFDACIVGAVKKIKNYIPSMGNLEGMNNELQIFLHKYISNSKLLRSINEEAINAKDT